MKKVLQIIILAAFSVSMLQAYSLVWANYDLINTGSDETRSLAYNPLTDHVLVATRKDSARIAILDAETGEFLGNLPFPEEGFVGGTYPINLIDIADDGAIYVCNLHAPAYNSEAFKVYRYADENSVPTVIFEDPTDGVRYGDSFAVTGSGENTYLYSAGWQSDQMIVLKIRRDFAEQNAVVTLPAVGAARHGISPVEPNGNLWINASDGEQPVRLIGSDGTLIAAVGDSIFSPGGSASVVHWEVGPLKILTVSNVFLSNTLKSCRYFEDELGTVTFDYLGWTSDSLMLAYNGTTMYNNANGSSALVYDNTRHRMYTVMGVNSVAAVDLNSLVRVATPRDAGWLAVNLDGYGNEYTHYDLIDESNERSMYVTWGEEIMYFAFDGNTLYNPFMEKALYIAYDLDPDGSNGSATPPSEASGISAYPFAADVVFQLWSDDAVDLSSDDPADKWTIGKVYKWNGSAWTESSIDGLDINYGAMAIIGDGYDGQMTEIGIARTPNGIGSDFTNFKMVAYLADEAAEGVVHAVWPPANATGAAPALTVAYASAGLDTMVLPMRHLIAENETSISQEKLVPVSFELGQAYPNPFNPMTSIPYTLSESAQVALQVYSLRGELVENYSFGMQDAGSYKIKVNGSQWPSGLYFYRLSVNEHTIGTNKMVLIK
jgi:hypothetical protein